MMEKLGVWFEERMGWRPIWKALALRNIPKVNWFYTLGSATLLVMVNQILTGILLTIYYVPSPQDAYNSVAFITNEITAGWLIRVVVHGAYKFPREVTWFTGLGLLAVTLAFGFTGYLLPWDQKAYWATTVGTRMLEVTPVVGDWLLRLARGGEELSAVTLTRFYGMHIWVLPAALLLLVGVHMFLVVRIGISAPPKPTRPDAEEPEVEVEA